MKRMNYFIYFMLVVLLFSGCATIQPKFEDSNQLFIERTVDSMDLGNAMKKKIPSGSKVALVSLEKEITLDKPIIALIEDQLIQSLMISGFKVIERDQNAVKNLIKENTHSDFYSLLQVENDFLNSTEVEISKIDFFSLNPVETKIHSAEYLISYRILECGVIYRDYDTKFDKREGLVRLHIRVQKTNNGEIIVAENIEGKKEDEIRKELVTQLADFHYSYFPYDYPLQPTERKEALIKTKPAQKFKSKKIYYYIGGGIGAFVLFSIGVGLF